MTTKQFRAAAGLHRSRELATKCGYTPENWRMQVSNDAEIPTDRLACMLDELERLARADLAFVKAARKTINTPPAGEVTR
jgi:hypothetical protein